MNNKIEISSDGINVYARLKVNASSAGVYILGALILTELLIFGWILLEVDSVKEIIHPAFLLLIFFFFFSVKYLLWNIYGSEELIVNTKTISWSYDYGFYKTNFITASHDRLGTGYEKIRRENGEELGRLVFFNYKNEDNLPEVMHHTTVLLKKEDIDWFDSHVSKVFENEFNHKRGFVPFSDN